MIEERWNMLMEDEQLNLTDEELKQGWHFCNSFDGLLIHILDPESEGCECGYEKWRKENEI